ncbi:unnamed protein product, partial [Brassica napus]
YILWFRSLANICCSIVSPVSLQRRFRGDKAKTLPWSCSAVIFAVISPITTNLVSPSCRRVFS